MPGLLINNYTFVVLEFHVRYSTYIRGGLITRWKFRYFIKALGGELGILLSYHTHVDNR